MAWSIWPNQSMVVFILHLSIFPYLNLSTCPLSPSPSNGCSVSLSMHMCLNHCERVPPSNYSLDKVNVLLCFIVHETHECHSWEQHGKVKAYISTTGVLRCRSSHFTRTVLEEALISLRCYDCAIPYLGVSPKLEGQLTQLLCTSWTRSTGVI